VFSVAEIAEVLGVSKQRVYQLLEEADPAMSPRHYRESEHGELPRRTAWRWLREYVLNWYALAWLAFAAFLVYVAIGITGSERAAERRGSSAAVASFLHRFADKEDRTNEVELRIPPPLIDQLTPQGRLIVPVIEGTRQRLTLLEKTADGVRRTILADVLYVPLQGRYGVASDPHA
jgi:AcrR family transcriptional regulator